MLSMLQLKILKTIHIMRNDMIEKLSIKVFEKLFAAQLAELLSKLKDLNTKLDKIDQDIIELIKINKLLTIKRQLKRLLILT